MGNLATYLKQAGRTQADFAREIGVNQATVSKICAGAVGVSLQTALRIEKATKGAVPVASLCRRDAPISEAG